MSSKTHHVLGGQIAVPNMDNGDINDKDLTSLQALAPSSQDVNSTTKQIPLAFVNLTEETGPIQDTRTRHKVRAHVMRDFQRKKHQKTKSMTNSTRVILPSQGHDIVETAQRSIEKKISFPEVESERGGTFETPIQLDNSNMWEMIDLPSPFVPGPLAGVDPFNAMPIHGSPVLQSLIHYYNNVLLNTLVPVNPKDKWFNHAISDSALFHGTMVHAASHKALAVPTSNSGRLAIIQMKRETIKIINERLANPVSGISDVTIGAVTLLVLFENQEGSVELSNIHMDGLEKMINLRGGLQALGTTFSGVLRRKVLWADLCNATLSGREPRFTLNSETISPFPACARIQRINDAFALFLLSQPPGFPPICACSEQFRELILELRSLGNMRRITYDLTGDLSDRIYLADRRLYMLMKDAVQNPERHSVDCAALGPSCFIAGSIYLYSSLRDFPLSVPIIDRFLERLAPMLLQNEDLLESWNKRWQLLLWVLTIAGNAAFQRQWRFELIVRLAKVCRRYLVTNFEAFVEQITGVVWRDADTDINLKTLWSEIECVMAFEALTV